MNKTHNPAVFHIMEAKMSEVIHENNEALWSIADNIPGPQGLVLVLFIPLSDGDSRQRALAEENEALLVRWTDQSNERTKNELVVSTSPAWP